MNNKAMFKLSYGLFVLTAKEGNLDNGCITNTAIQVTSEPNRIAIAVNKANFTHNMLINTGKFNISVISQKASFDLFKRFGFQSGRDTEKLEGFEGNYMRAENGIIYITQGTNAYLSAEIEETVDLGTHTLFIASVTDMEVLDEASSCTYEYYQNNIKPKPQAAPKPAGKTAWRCTICGYIYEGEEIPADFICPWCKHPASDFEKITI